MKASTVKLRPSSEVTIEGRWDDRVGARQSEGGMEFVDGCNWSGPRGPEMFGFRGTGARSAVSYVNYQIIAGYGGC